MKKNIFLIFLCCAGLFIGCARASHTYTADGQEGFCIDCSGTALTWGDCYKKAGEICQGSGYEILEKVRVTPTFTLPSIKLSKHNELM